MMTEPIEPTTTGQPVTPNAAAADAGQAGQPAPIATTQEQFDAMVKDRLERGSEKAKADVLAELGIEDVATAKKTLAEAQAAKAAQMTELEKAQAQIAEAQAQAAQSTTEAEAVKAQAAEALLRAAIISQAGSFNDPNDAWQFVDRSKIEVQEDGTYKGVDEALKAVADAKPYLVKADGQPGTGTPARPKRQTIVEKLIEGQQKKEAAGEPRRSTIRM